MPRETWIYDDESRLHSVNHLDHVLLVGDRTDGKFEASIADSEGNVIWEAEDVYDGAGGAKRAARAAVKRLTTPDPSAVPNIADSGDERALRPDEPAHKEARTKSFWKEEGGRLVGSLTHAGQTASCAIVPLEANVFLGFVRLRDVVLRLDHADLAEAKHAVVNRAEAMLDQLVPSGLFAGGL